jgi:hypothetical protein
VKISKSLTRVCGEEKKKLWKMKMKMKMKRGCGRSGRGRVSRCRRRACIAHLAGGVRHGEAQLAARRWSLHGLWWSTNPNLFAVRTRCQSSPGAKPLSLCFEESVGRANPFSSARARAPKPGGATGGRMHTRDTSCELGAVRSGMPTKRAHFLLLLLSLSLFKLSPTFQKSFSFFCPLTHG